MRMITRHRASSSLAWGLTMASVLALCSGGGAWGGTSGGTWGGAGVSSAQATSNDKGAQGAWLEGFNFRYTIAGVGKHQPTQVFDDGVNTWIQFEQLRANPLILAERAHSPLAFKQEGDFVRIVGVYEQLLLHVADEAYVLARHSPVFNDSTALPRGMPNTWPQRGAWREAAGAGASVDGGSMNANVNRFERRALTAATRMTPREDVPAPKSASSWQGHSYATPLHGDTLHFQGDQSEQSSRIHYRYGIDFLPRQRHLDAAQFKRVSTFLKTLPKDARLSVFCAQAPAPTETVSTPTMPSMPSTPGSVSSASTALATTAGQDPSQEASQAHIKDGANSAALFDLRWDLVSDLLAKAGFTKDQLEPKRSWPREGVSSRSACLNSLVLEWWAGSPRTQDTAPRVLLKDLTLLRALQRLGSGTGWRVVATDAPSVPIVKEAALSASGFVESAKELIGWANQAGFAVKGTRHEGQVLLLSKGDGLE